MTNWLVKSEPDAYAYADLVTESADAGRGTWDGVRNHQAAANLRAMVPGDLVLFYHSVTERAIVGTARVVGAARPDPTDATGKWVAVDLRAEAPWERPVTLGAIEADPRLAGMALVRQSRLSVGPVTDAEAGVLRELAGL